MPEKTVWHDCHRHLDGYPIVIDAEVAWGEMDSLGHVNNVVYFRYFESARIAYFDRIGYWGEMKETGCGPILAETSCRFRAPLKYPAAISIGARAGDIGEDRFVMNYAVATKDYLAATGHGLIVSYNYRQNRKTALPTKMVAAINGLQKTFRNGEP